MKRTSLFSHKGKVYIKQTDYKGKVFIILMSGPSAIHILTAALNIKSNDPNRGAKAHAMVMKFSTSAFVIVPLGTTTAALADIASFNAAIGVARKTTWNQVNTDLKSVMRLFANAMGLDPVHAEQICVSGGFKVKGVGIKQKNVFSLSQGTSSGVIDCIGDVLNPECIHEWKLSKDGITYINMRATQGSFKQFIGLLPERWWVQHQCIMDNGKDGVMRTLFIDLI